MANNTQIRWKAIEHPYSKKQGHHVILVAYKKIAHHAGGGSNKVVAVSPLYDLRDTNLDGSVSILEWGLSKGWYDPYEVFSLMKPASETSCLLAAGRALRDQLFVMNAQKGFLKTTHKACARALTTLTIERCLSPGIELNLANTGLANLRHFSSEAQFVVQTVLETAIMESICSTYN